MTQTLSRRTRETVVVWRVEECCENYFVLTVFVVLVVSGLVGVFLVEESHMSIERCSQQYLLFFEGFDRSDLFFVDLDSMDQL